MFVTHQEIAQIAREQAETLALEIIGEAPTSRRGDQIRFGGKGSLVVFIAGPRQGSFNSFEDDAAKGDIVDLYCWINGASKRDAFDWLQNRLGVSLAKKTEPTKESAEAARKRAEERDRERAKAIAASKAAEERDRAKRIARARKIWNGAAQRPYQACLDYLALRGVRLVSGSYVMRYRAIDESEGIKLSGGDPERAPTHSIVFGARRGKDPITAVQEIFIRDGAKAVIDVPKRTIGVIDGAAATLPSRGPCHITIIAEGPETALSIWMSVGASANVRISFGTSNIAKMHFADEEKRITIASDIEPSGGGLAAALDAAQSLARRDIDASIALPNVANGDFNDVLVKYGAEKVSSLVLSPFHPQKPAERSVAVITSCPQAGFYLWTVLGGGVVVRRPNKDKKTGLFRPLDIGAVALDDDVALVMTVLDPLIQMNGAARTTSGSLPKLRKGPPPQEIKRAARTPGALRSIIRRELGVDPGKTRSRITPPSARISRAVDQT